jgi:hypothetical protein
MTKSTNNVAKVESQLVAAVKEVMAEQKQDVATNDALFRQKANGGISIAGIDLESLRETQDFHGVYGVVKQVLNVPTHKPPETEFFRVRDGAEWVFQTSVLNLKSENETYLVAPEVKPFISDLLKPVELYVSIDRHGNLRLIPVGLPGPDGRRNRWHESLSLVVDKARTRWVRCKANMSIGSYEMSLAGQGIPEPEWPDLSMQQILEIAFRSSVIDKPDHPVVQRLLGNI